MDILGDEPWMTENFYTLSKVAQILGVSIIAPTALCKSTERGLTEAGQLVEQRGLTQLALFRPYWYEALAQLFR